MTDQLHLFRATDPNGSRQAARRLVRSGRLATDMTRVLEALQAHPGLSSKDLAAAIGADRYMVARRLPDLASRGQARREEPPVGDCRWYAV